MIVPRFPGGMNTHRGFFHERDSLSCCLFHWATWNVWKSNRVSKIMLLNHPKHWIHGFIFPRHYQHEATTNTTSDNRDACKYPEWWFRLLIICHTKGSRWTLGWTYDGHSKTIILHCVWKDGWSHTWSMSVQLVLSNTMCFFFRGHHRTIVLGKL